MKGFKRFVALTLIVAMVGAVTGCKRADVQDLNIIDDNYRTWYEVFLYSFYDSDGDGVGDINGLIEKLDYINDNDAATMTDLGCNGIWLMPIMQSTTYHKYDVVDYYTVDAEYGTNEDFERLIEECHARGINVIIDLVINHISARHTWFVNACKYLKELPKGAEPSVEECPYVEYYNFVRYDEVKSGYYQVGDSDWYYEAIFWDQMPDLNLKSEAVRAELEAVAKYWLDMGVDGFRIDAAKEFVSGNVEANVEILSWLNDYVKSVKEDCYLVAEVWESLSGFSQYYASGIDSIFNYSYGGGSSGKIATYAKNVGNEDIGSKMAATMVETQNTLAAYNANYIDASFINNHDNARSGGYVVYDPNLMKLMGGINLMMSGSSFIYYGEEIGMKGSGKKDENYRAPMFWSATNTEGMTDGPSGMEAQESKFEAVDKQLGDDSSILNYYINAIRLRNENPEIARGVIEAVEMEDTTICAISKTYNGSTIYILYNLSDTDKQVTLSKESYTYESIKGCLLVSDSKPKLKNDTLTLPAYSIVILK